MLSLTLGFFGQRQQGFFFFGFLSPAPELVTGSGEKGWVLFAAPLIRDIEITITSPTGSAPGSFDVPRNRYGWRFLEGTASAQTAGRYELRADAVLQFFFFFRFDVSTTRGFDVVDLGEAPDVCDPLNATECMLPYPSSRFLIPGDTATGVQLAVPQEGIPEVNGTPIPASLWEGIDGFSPTSQILMHFPQGVDVEASGLSRLLDEGAAPPWIDTRTHDDSSLGLDHPTLLLDWDTGEPVLHWAENDARASSLERKAFVIRPAVSLTPGRRYIVAARNLRSGDGEEIAAEAAFEAIRDRRPSDIPALNDRRREIRPVLRRLHRLGIPTRDLVLAFDFTVQSDHQLTHQMLAMRDQAFAWLDEQIAADVQTFTVDTVEEFPSCLELGEAHRRIVSGTFQSPLFLAEAPSPENVAQFVTDESDTPIPNGTMDAPFTVSIPCIILEDDAPPLNTILLGHGIFGRGSQLVRGIPSGAEANLSQFEGTPRWNYISGATDWSGWSSPDFLWAGSRIVGFGMSQLHNFPAFPDRHRQGQVNTLILSRMMKRAVMNRDPAFQLGGEGVFPESNRDRHFYYGISMGGVMGLFHSAITPDIERLAVDVPAINFSFLLQRSTQFSTFELVLGAIGLSEPMSVILGMQLLHEIWVGADPAGYATHITSEPLPDTIAKKMLLTPAWLDHQVSNHATEMTARTLGVGNLHGSIQQRLSGIPDAAPGSALDSALVLYDSGALDIRDPSDVTHIPRLTNEIVEDSKCDPHGARPAIPAGGEQLIRFLQPGGVIENFCNGLCDAGEPFEIASGADTPCSPN
jgi:hypothetical protein